MSLLDQIVSDALRYSDNSQLGLSSLRPVVEKEILHHDILKTMSDGGFLKHMAFIGGTCLRVCYGSNRLSEDLDFATERIEHAQMNQLAQRLETNLGQKYGLPVSVGEPTAHQQDGDVSTWKIRITTAPERPDLPKQRINLDICAVAARDVSPQAIRNPYGIELPTTNLVVRAESREEIFIDKVIALAQRPGRIKHRDLWDMAWLTQQQIKPAFELLPLKLQDRHIEAGSFIHNLSERIQEIQTHQELAQSFEFEMRRFIPPAIAANSLDNPDFWAYIQNTVSDTCTDAIRYMENGPEPQPTGRFRM